MKYDIRHILPALAVIAVLLSVTGCRDDFDYKGTLDITGETTTVSLTADFMPASEGSLASRSEGSVANAGDCMADIEDLCLVIFDGNGKYYGHQEISQYDVTEEYRTDDNASNGTIAGEIKTKRISFDCQMPIGTYYLYALANMGNKTENGTTTTYEYINSLDLIKGESTREDFEAQRKSWDTSRMLNNSGMTGFFTNGQGASPATLTETETGLHGGTVTVTSQGTKLHCWLRRMASKLTVTFDASGLCPDVYVYIRDVCVHNIVADCNLFGPNTPAKNDDLVPEADNTQILMFCNKEDAGSKDLSDVHSHYENWPCLTAKTKSMSNLVSLFPHLNDYTHANNAPSLFFYENMQGEGESKLQDADFDGKVDSPNSNESNDPHFRDGKPYGTYVEVTAYYVSRNRERLGNGTIKYRFMLGKNDIKDYNTERNYHYKLTLRLLGYANEVDWHIEYDTEREDISIPNPCYISYSSAERLTVPILVYGDLTKAEATIVRNDWEPSIPWTDKKPTGEDVYYEGALDYYTGVDTGTGQNKVNALGFLSLRKPDYDAVGNHISGSAFNTPQLHEYLWNYWTGNGDEIAGSPKGTQNEKRSSLYNRSYSTSSGSHDSDDLLGDGSYTVTRNADPSTNHNTTRIEVPLYTRERNLVKTTGLSGANPYEAYQRRAKVKYHLEFTRGAKTITVDTVISVIQVERIVNPSGVWRSWNNARPFLVKLSQLNGASSMSFHTLESRGSWSAEVEIGSDWILLNGRRTNVMGETGTNIEFEIKPAGLLANANEVRCGVVLVRYHNNTCVHRIFVRQGYAPIAINTDGPVWHTFNLVSADREATSPLDEGSMFRFSNLAQPIASSNNVNDKYPWINVKPSDFIDHTNDLLEIVDNEPTKWENITSDKFPKLVDGDAFDFSGLKVSGRMMTAHDVALLRDNIHNRFRFGVCYGDAATTTEVHIDQVYGYKALDSHGNYGMRGCFVFNTQTGAQIFFPIGSSGYGIRRFVRETTDWINFTVYIRAKYAGSASYFSIPNKSPMFYHLFRSPGAMYWCERNVANEISDVSGRDEVDKNAAGLDINYFSYDFNNAQENNFYTDGHWYLGTHACFVRLLDGPVIKYNKSDLNK